MREALLQALRIRPHEAQKALLMMAYLLLAVSVFILGRIARDALFLTVFTKEDLAYMYISVAVMVPLPAYFYAQVADRFRRDRLIIATLGIIAVMLLVCRALLATGEAWVYVVLYNFVEVMGTFLVLQFWTFAGDVFSSREAKRLFPVVGTGAVIASIVCGLAVSGLVRIIGTENLIFAQVLLLGCCVLIVSRLGAMERSRLADAIVSKRRQQDSGRTGKFRVKSQVQGVFASKHLKIVAGMTVATFITVPLIDYQFKVLAKEYFTSGGVVRTDALSSFNGIFTAATGVIAAVMQLGLTGRILERFGVVVSLVILPATLLFGMTGMLAGVAGAFACAVFTKGAENSFRYSIYDSTMQVIYTPVPGHLRGRAKTFIDGILKPLAGGVAGGAMVLIVGPLGLPIESLAIVAVALTGLWLGLILLIRAEYVKELMATLRRRRLDFGDRQLVINDEQTVNLLRRALQSSDPAEARNAVELGRRVQGYDLSEDVAPLLQHPDPDLRRRALEILERSGSIRFSDAILARCDDPVHEVAAAAVRAFCAVVGEPALRVVRARLDSPHAAVRGAAVGSLIRHGGLEGILISAEHLKAMQSAPDEEVRLAAAQVFRDIGVKNFFQPVLELMRDPSPRVQNAAVAAAGAMRSKELIPALVYKLSQRDTARAAALALASFGDAVVDTLGKVLAQEREEPVVRRQIPRILERIGTERCLDELMKNLPVKDPDTRRETARSAARLRDRLGRKIDTTRVRTILDEEIKGHYQKLAALTDLVPVAGESGPDLLRDAIEERLHRSLDRLFRLLAILYPLKAMELIHQNLKSDVATVRANAIEVLDNLLDGDDKRRILPILEDLPRAQIVARGVELYRIERKPPEDWIAGFLSGTDPWLVIVALHVVAELGVKRFVEGVRPHLHHPDPIVRETALRAMAVLSTPTEFVEAVAGLADDGDIIVQRMRRSLLDQAITVLERDDATASLQRSA